MGFYYEIHECLLVHYPLGRQKIKQPDERRNRHPHAKYLYSVCRACEIVNYDDLIWSKRSSCSIPLTVKGRDIVGNWSLELQSGLSPRTLCAYLRLLAMDPKALSQTNQVSRKPSRYKFRSSNILNILFSSITPFYRLTWTGHLDCGLRCPCPICLSLGSSL